MGATRLPARVYRALGVMAEHSAVTRIGLPVFDDATKRYQIQVDFTIDLPSEWKGQGSSPSGVRNTEVVRFDFSRAFPTLPPLVSLRADFSRDHPHLQPWLIDGRPVPCIYDGNITQLLHREGFAAIVNQMATWLENAAFGTLIDPEHGWEPVRRDSYNDWLYADGAELCAYANDNGGYRFVRLGYAICPVESGTRVVIGYAKPSVVRLRQGAVADLFKEDGTAGSNSRIGRSVALVVWPPAFTSDGLSTVCGTYLPETVASTEDLRERAALYGCVAELDRGLKRLKQYLSTSRKPGRCEFAVVLLARRPFKLIGRESSIEVCPYYGTLGIPDMFSEGSATVVRPVAHREVLSRSLLARVSGGEAASPTPRWALIGAGSLGSKLAIHLARAGHGPETVVDDAPVAAHNAARHALLPHDRGVGVWSGMKAKLLAEAICSLGQECTGIVSDAESVLDDKARARNVFSAETWAVINATASPVVRNALAAAGRVSTRVIETSLYSGGALGVVTVEGPERNPNTNDLIAEYYLLVADDPAIAGTLFVGDDSVVRSETGQGCGSLTMTMSDARLSLFAAGIAEYLLSGQYNGLPAKVGQVVIGRLCGNGPSITWHSNTVAPLVELVAQMDSEEWTVRVHQRAAAKMEEEVKRYRQVETGGVLVGRISEQCRTVNIVDTLPAPTDSVRSRHEFRLGKRGLLQGIREYCSRAGWTIYCLGTWHSHLMPSGPSRLDRETAKAVSLARLTPSCFLIHTPAGYRAVLTGAKDQ